MRDLFDFMEGGSQDEHMARVASKIGLIIETFCTPGRMFTMEELRAHVLRHEPNTAPDSPSRILRALRLAGLVRYRVISRRDSLYEVLT